MIASFCTIQRTCIVTQISLILQEKSPNVRSWIHLEFPKISVGFWHINWIQIELRLNFETQNLTSILVTFQKCISWITFARGKVVGIWYLLGWRADREESESAVKNTFYFSVDGATFCMHTCVQFCFGAFSSGLRLALALRWPKLGLQE